MLPLNTDLRLGRKAFLLMLERKFAAPGLVFIVGLLVWSIRPDIAGMIFSVAILFFLIQFLIVWLNYKNFTFRFEEFGLSLKKGIIDINTDTIPYRQIQSVSVDRSLLHRIMGLSKVTITTAGRADNTDDTVILEPIDENFAEEIRQKLQREIGVQVIEREKTADEETIKSA